MAKQSPALRKAQTQLAAARKRASSYRSEARSVSGATWKGFQVLAGAASAGAAKAYLPDFMGLPTDAAGGLLVGGASLAMGSPGGLMFAIGWLAPYVADMTQDAIMNAQTNASAARAAS